MLEHAIAQVRANPRGVFNITDERGQTVAVLLGVEAAASATFPEQQPPRPKLTRKQRKARAAARRRGA